MATALGTTQGATPGSARHTRGRGEGHIRQRADGRWEAQYSAGGRLHSLYAATRAEVHDKLQDALRRLRDGLAPVDARMRLGPYLVTWLAGLHGLREATVHRHGELVHGHLIPGLGQIPLAALAPAHLRAFYGRLRTAGTLSDTTIHHVHATLHRALATAAADGTVARNVASLVQAPKIARREMRVYTATEAKHLLDACEDSRWGPVIALAVSTGLRQGELLGLRWRDVDLEGATLQVRAALKRTRTTHEYVVAEPKTARGRRQIALAPPAVEALRAQRRRQAEERLRAGAEWADHDLIFTTAEGRPMSGNTVYHQYQKLCRRVGLPVLRFHDLRHTAATLLLGAGVNPKIVSEMLGHASVGITLDTYSHVLPSMQREAAAALGAVLARG